MNDTFSHLKSLPSTRAAVDAILSEWPEHQRYLRTSFSDRTARVDTLIERTAELAARLSKHDFERLAKGYRWMCEMMAEEELHFRRSGAYRNSSFAEVNTRVYQDPEYMGRYMDGLLFSHILWSHHASVLDFFVNSFLPGNGDGYRHLEVGPGHGLLLYFAASDPRSEHVVGWDISPASIKATASCLDTLEVSQAVTLQERDVLDLDYPNGAFDSIVLSEILEHLEDPLAVLKRVHDLLSPSGRLFVHVPINAPAVDHIYLLSTPEEALALLDDAGFAVELSHFAPPAGYSIERARRRSSSISCAMIATTKAG